MDVQIGQGSFAMDEARDLLQPVMDTLFETMEDVTVR